MPDAAERPNVLLIMTDQQRWDSLAVAGHPAARTPNLDALARGGVLFDRAFTCHPTCTPSRSTIFTGRYPSSHGARMTGMILSEAERTLPQVLGEHGYETALFGKPHFAPMGNWDDCPSREMQNLWVDGRRPIERDYYGFQRVAFCGGHGYRVWGDYSYWVEVRAPEVAQRIRDFNGYDRNRPAGAIPEGYPDGTPETLRSPVPAELHYSTYLAETTENFLRERHEKPFFAVVSFPDPHHPFCPPEEYADRYDPLDMPAPAPRDPDGYRDWPPHVARAYHGTLGDSSGGGRIDYANLPDAAHRRAQALTCAMIELIDDSVGQIVRSLDETGLRRNTVVIFLSDHGDLLGDHGFHHKGPHHWDGILRVPYLWNWPERFQPRRVRKGVGSTIDVAPTVYELCGVPAPEGIEGRSIAACLAGGANPRGEALTENDDDYIGERLRTLTTEDWRITAYAGRPYGELFDRRNDPQETRNLWSDPGYRRMRDEMRLRLLDHVLVSQDRLPPQRWYA